MQHSVEALSPVTLCVFERSRLNNLFTDHPTLAYDLTWIAASEERMLDSHLLSIGRRTALERAAYLIVFLYSKAKAVHLIQGKRRSRSPSSMWRIHLACPLSTPTRP